MMEELTKNHNRPNDNRCVPNCFNLLVNLNFTKSRSKRCWNIILIHSFHLCLFVTVIGAEVTKTTVVVNVGGEISLPCAESEQYDSSQLSWSHPGKLNMTGSFVVKESGALVLMDTSLRDAGMYHCLASNTIIAQVNLQVNNVPSRINNILISSNSVYSIGRLI